MEALDEHVRSQRFIPALALAGAIYMLLVSGGVVPYAEDDSTKALIKGGMLAVTLYYFSRNGVGRHAAKAIGVFVFLAILIISPAFVRTDHLGFALEKIDGAIFCPASLVILLERGRLRFGEDELWKAFIGFAVGILMLTLVYKLRFGFFERDVRFFLNGPIVYGWLMGLSGVLSFHLWRQSRRTIFGVMFVVFFAALIWTESKGSIFAFMAAVGFYILCSARRDWRFSLLVVVLVAVVYFAFAESIVGAFSNTRLSALSRIYSGQLSQADDGSVGVRLDLVHLAIEEFKENPLMGIGLGQFSQGEYVYPHNQHVEIFTEAGVFVGSLHLIFILVAFWRSSLLIRALAILSFLQRALVAMRHI